MKITPAKAIASALAVSLLALPAGLSAKERRGANLIVTRLDGSQVAGELIAVKRDSLLLLSYGRDESIDLTDIKTVRIVKKSLAGKGALYGFLAGALSGAGVGLAMGRTDLAGGKTPLLTGGLGGAIGVFGGLLVGSMAGLDSSFTVAGYSEAAVSAYWDKLRAYSREGRLPGARVSREKMPKPTPQTGAIGPVRSPSSRLTGAGLPSA